MEENKSTFIVLNDEGVEIECEVLFTFESTTTHTNYIIYTDNTIDAEGNTKVFASIFNPDEEEPDLLPIETEEEWEIIEEILENLQGNGEADELDESDLSPEMRDYFMDGMK